MALSDLVLYHICPVPFSLLTLPASGLAQAGPAPALTGGPWALPTDSLATFQQHTALHGPLASADLGLAPAPSPGVDRKALAEATNGEARAGPQNGGGG